MERRELDNIFIEQIDYDDLKNYDTIDANDINGNDLMKLFITLSSPDGSFFSPMLYLGVLENRPYVTFFNIVNNLNAELIIFKNKEKLLYAMLDFTDIASGQDYDDRISDKIINRFIKKTKIFKKGILDGQAMQILASIGILHSIIIRVVSLFDEFSEVEEVERLPRNKKEQKEYNTAKYIKNQPIKLFKKKYKFISMSDKDIEHIAKKYNFSFGVRGHKRHYEEKTVVCKNGTVRHYKEKIVDIKPFTKGNGDYKSKKYKL